ncbi:MAG: adenosylcobinamide-GDP ribazoletransferase [Candidatus Endobugula sp.]|jgi:adenosylcobinamide-GDP ribazoletransferase
MQTQLRAFLMAISLLTRIPVTKYLPQQWRDQELALSALWYPMVGVVIAAFFICVTLLLPTTVSPWVGAIVLLTSWVVITGALHLDGVADCVDAMYAAHAVIPSNDDDHSCREKIFTVLKEPTVGSMAVIALLLILFLKVILLASLWPEIGVSVLFALVVSRSAAVVFIVTTPYARTGGLASILATDTPKNIAFYISAFIVGGLFLSLSLISWLLLLLGLVLLLIVWRRYWIKTLGGFVGDAVGALIEMIEVWVLLLFYCASL